jgi:outer membrane receptor protein involved in Fe transport
MDKMKTNTLFTRNLLAAAVAVALPGAAVAQQLEEVMVTATKRVESTQDIPMAVEAFDGETLNQLGVVDFATLSETIPNFNVGDGVVTTNVSMRGMGSGVDRSFEQSVGMFIDDIYMPRSRQYRSPFFDAERVEVLRGPQAVLFGLNSTAGAVAIHTARSRPGDDFGANLTLAYETEYEGVRGAVVLGGSPTDRLGLRFAAEYIDTDGYFDNDFNGKTEGNREAELYRLSAVWEPTDNLTIDAKYEWVDYDQDGSHGEAYGTDAAAILDGGDGKLNWRRNVDSSLIGTYPKDAGGTQNVKPGLYQEIENASIKLDYLLGDYTLTGIFGYSDMEYSFGLDLDTIAGGLTPADINSGAGFIDASISPETYEQTSFEFRVTSPGGAVVDWLAGIYYQDSEFFNDNESAYNLDTVLPAFGLCEVVGLCGLGWGEYQSNEMEVDQELWSVYGTLTWNVTEVVRVIAGARYSDEDKEADRGGDCKFYDIASGAVTAEGALFCTTFYTGIQGDRSSDNFMPELVVQWDAGDNSMIYGKVGTSAKAGGFATASTIIPESWEYDDEKVITYELGYKARFGGVAELNAVLFRSEYDDLQVNSFIVEEGQTIGLIQNAAETVNQGLEVDGRWAATEWMTLGGSVAWLDAEYEKYKNGTCSTTEQAAGLTNPCNKSGETPPYAPEFSGSVYADFVIPMGASLNFVANLTAYYSDEYFTEGSLDPAQEQDSYTRVSGRLGVEASDGKWDVSVIGRNLTEEEVLDVSQPWFGYNLGYIGAPRTITIQANYRFGN